MTAQETPPVITETEVPVSAPPVLQQAPTLVTEVPATATPVVTTTAPQPVGVVTQPDRVVTRSVAEVRPVGGGQLIRRTVVLIFGLIQLVIGLRIVLLLLDARTGNALVSGILDVSKVFVAPFEGILKTSALSSGGSVLDVSAIVAFVGWSILELIVLWVIGIFRREPA
jgi:hypothetical protein